MSSSKLVYSTDIGRINEEKPKPTAPKGDGIVRIQRQVSGRKGKGVIVISGLGLEKDALTKLASLLKKKCGTGGSVKDFDIEIQGENRELVKSLLEKEGYTVKLAGG